MFSYVFLIFLLFFFFLKSINIFSFKTFFLIFPKKNDKTIFFYNIFLVNLKQFFKQMKNVKIFKYFFKYQTFSKQKSRIKKRYFK